MRVVDCIAIVVAGSVVIAIISIVVVDVAVRVVLIGAEVIESKLLARHKLWVECNA